MAFIARVCWLASALLLGVEAMGCGQVGEANEGSRAGAGNAASPGAQNEAGDGGAPGAKEPNLLGTAELGVCNAQGWCWQNPVPAGDLFNAISDDGRYAVGENGIVFQWPDRYLPSAGSSNLFYVQSAGDTVWAGGYGLQRYDGANWTVDSPAQVGALSVSPSGEVWALLGQTVQHRGEGQWLSAQPAAIAARGLQLLDLIVVDDDTVWALATSFVSPKDAPDSADLSLFEFRAGAWTERGPGPKDPGSAWRFMRAGSKVYVHVQDGAQGVYSPADDWALVLQEPETAAANEGLFSSTTGELLVSERDGLYVLTDQGTQKVSDTRCSALVPTSAEEALCAQPSGGLSLIRTNVIAGDEPAPHLAAALFGSVPTPVWAQAQAAWGSGPTDVWRSSLEHFDGLKWTSYSDQLPEDFHVNAIDGSAPDNVWFRGFQQLVRYDGQAFHSVALPEEGGTFLSALHTLAANDTWIVCGEPERVNVWHFDGATWENTLTNDDSSIAYEQAAFAGGGSEPLWAAIGHTLYRREGDAWQKVLTGNGYSLIDLAVDGSDVWLLGQDAVSQLVDGALVPRGTESSVLDRIALTEHQVWHFSGSHARTLLRQK